MTAKTAQAFQHQSLFDLTQPWQTEIYQREIDLPMRRIDAYTRFSSRA